MDVLPLWYKEQRSIIIWVVGMGLLVAGYFRYVLFGEANKDWFPVLWPAFFTFRRFLNGFVRQRWIQTMASKVGTGRNTKSFLSPPKDYGELIDVLVDGGPLGPGCAKLLDVLVGLASMPLLRFLPTTVSFLSWTTFCGIGPLWPNWWLPLVVVLISIAVNGVLWLWSSIQQKSRGAHEGVHRMVKGTISRNLTTAEHLVLLGWSLVNAVCEEMSSRGLNRWEFATLLGSKSIPSNHVSFLDLSNIWQAASFGLAHFYGVPSGWTGVILTFVYGWLMGTLHDAAGGLLYPILTHTIADYFIFSQIARRRK